MWDKILNCIKNWWEKQKEKEKPVQSIEELIKNSKDYQNRFNKEK